MQIFDMRKSGQPQARKKRAKGQQNAARQRLLP
jgi:hypothetical protein